MNCAVVMALGGSYKPPRAMEHAASSVLNFSRIELIWAGMELNKTSASKSG